MKIVLILAIAKFFDEKKIQTFKEHLFIIFPILLIVVPFLIILKQPDLGTGLIILSLGFVIFFIVGVNIKFFILCFIIFFNF